MNGSGPAYTILLLLVYKGVMTLDEAIKAQYAAQKAGDKHGITPADFPEIVLCEKMLNSFTEEMNKPNP